VVGCLVTESRAAGRASTSLLTRCDRFSGDTGSSMLGLVLTISLMGWFGVPNRIFAEGPYSLCYRTAIPLWSWVLLNRPVLLTVIVICAYLVDDLVRPTSPCSCSRPAVLLTRSSRPWEESLRQPGLVADPGRRWARGGRHGWSPEGFIVGVR